jgi:tetratricopeptide (TPR) repeat protein
MAPSRDFLWLNLAMWEEQAGDLAQAAEYYLRARCLNPGLAGTLLYQQNELPNSTLEEPCLAEQDTLARDQALQYRYEGLKYLQNGELEQAEQAFQASIWLVPSTADAYAYLAQVHAAMGDSQQAKQDMRTALYVNSGSVPVLIIAAEFAEQRGDSVLAQQYISKAFHLLTDIRFANSYYINAYRRASLPFDYSPSLVVVPATQNMLEVFSQHADYLELNGKRAQAAQVRDWIDKQYALVQ